MFSRFLTGFLSPGFNRYTVIGAVLCVIGLVLTPVIIGMPILAIGWMVLIFGTLISVIERFPGGHTLLVRIRNGAQFYIDWFTALFREGFGPDTPPPEKGKKS